MLKILHTNTTYIDFSLKKNSMFIHALSLTKGFHFRNFFLENYNNTVQSNISMKKPIESDLDRKNISNID